MEKYKVYPPVGYKFPTEDGSRIMDEVEILLHPLTALADLTGDNGFEIAKAICKTASEMKTPKEAVLALVEMGFDIEEIK